MITIISNHLLGQTQRASIFLSKTLQLSSYKFMWWKRAENGLQDLAMQSARKKALVIVGKVGITPTSLAPHKHEASAFLCNSITQCHLLFPSFIWGPEVLHIYSTFLSLRALAAIVLGGKTTNLIKVIGRRETQTTLSEPPLQLSPASLGYTQAERCRPFSGPWGTRKLTTNQTFHLVPEQNNLCERNMYYSS